MGVIINVIKKTWIKKSLLFLKLKIYLKIKKFLKCLLILIRNIGKLTIKDESLKLYYFGIAVHRNLGDLAQSYCIRKWISENYYNYKVVEMESLTVVGTPFSLLWLLKKCINSNDIIVFQSGYTTTDLGGAGDELHRVIIEAFKDTKILMMPQTIFFKSEANKMRTSEIYNMATNMLFLARDKISYYMAIGMFPDVNVKLFPDIVTSLIGTRYYNYTREDIVMCCRNDSEQFYSSEEMNILKVKLSLHSNVIITDTTKSDKTSKFLENYITHVNGEIDQYAHCKVLITDRFHGMIFSLVAGTPVIVLKTTDHKVTVGAEWFDIFSDYVFLANSLEHAYELALEVMKKPLALAHTLEPYFKQEYYDKLPEIWNNNIT